LTSPEENLGDPKMWVTKNLCDKEIVKNGFVLMAKISFDPMGFLF
jgi:hypothetical protein